jgi:tetratricopeptide (TPR) repeat protein
MRYAVILAPWDPGEPDDSVWVDAVAWLSAMLRNLDFRVAIVRGGGDEYGELVEALAEAGPRDSVLLHVSGRLARRGVLRLAGGRWLALRDLGDALVERGLVDVSVLAELVSEDGASDPLSASDEVDAVVGALEARERGYGVVATVRSPSSNASGFAFTRLLMHVASAARPEDGLLSRVFDRVASMPERLLVQGIAFERGRHDLRLVPEPSIEELDQLIASATDLRDWQRAIQLRRLRLRIHTTVRARVRELVSIARILQAELEDAEGAIAALEEARALDPNRIPVLQALRRGYERTGRWPGAIETVRVLARLAATATDRAELHFACARMTLEHLDDPRRAVSLLHKALQDDPAHERARAALAALQAQREPEELDSEELVDEDPGYTDPPTERDLAHADTEEATALDDAEMQALVEVEADEPELEEITGPTGRARLARGDVLDAITHAHAFSEHRREGRTDRALLAALALEELGAADVDHQALIEQFRSVAPIRARATLDAHAWALLGAHASDQPIDAVFAAVARPAVAARLEELGAQGRLVELDPSARVQPSSTALVVRTFHWAARVLGVPCPALYLMDRVPGDIAAVRAHTPSTAVGPAVVRGRSPKDLAFLAGRHLSYYRPVNQVAAYYPTRQDLVRLLFASVQLVLPNTAAPEDAQVVASLRRRLAGRIIERERVALVHAVRQLEADGGKASVGGWMRGVELTAARAGLLLSGDLATATSIVRTESRTIAELSIEEKRRDLVAFGVSEAHAALRNRYAAIAPESVKPPPPHVAGMARAAVATPGE